MTTSPFDFTSYQTNFSGGATTSFFSTSIQNQYIQPLVPSSGSPRFNGSLVVPPIPSGADCPLLNDTTWFPSEGVFGASGGISSNTQNPIILFPWLPATCQFFMLENTRAYNPQAYIVYNHSDMSSNLPPPQGNSARNDPWPIAVQTYNPAAPIYAIPGSYAHQIMQALANYAANASLTPVPGNTTIPTNTTTPTTSTNGTISMNSTVATPTPSTNATVNQRSLSARDFRYPVQNVTQTYPDAWITSSFSVTSSDGGLPDLWIIVLCVVAVFLGALAFISIITRLIQRRRRHDLRRRILNGQVDMSILGVKKVTVPEDVLATFPVKRYADVDGSNSANVSPTLPVTKGSSAHKSKKSNASTTPTDTLKYSQPSCAICIDDYEDDSMVRILPCGHVFHPECVDTFLKENSSLCPLCKQTVLPKGYCPAQITNAMVRRDRVMQNPQAFRTNGGPRGQSFGVIVPYHRNGNVSSPEGAPEQVTAAPDQASEHSESRPGFATRMRRAVFRQPQPNAQQDVELQPTAVSAPAEPAVTTTTAEAAPVSTAAQQPPGPSATRSERREWARRRALRMVDNVADPTEEQERHRPAWRKAVGKVFPGL